MLGWIACVLSGQHGYTVWSQEDRIFLRCNGCGKRSKGLAVRGLTEQADSLKTPGLHGWRVQRFFRAPA